MGVFDITRMGLFQKSDSILTKTIEHIYIYIISCYVIYIK